MNLGKFVLEIFLPGLRARKRSWETDERIAGKYILPEFGAKKFSAITSLDIEAWASSLAARDLGGSSRNRIFSVFRGICAQAHDHGLIRRMDANLLRSFPVPRRVNRYLNEEEARALWEELQKHTHKAAIALRLILLTGCRKNEILKARRENVDLRASRLIIPMSKSGQPRYVPLCAEAKRTIAEHVPTSSSPWLFPGRNQDKPVSDIYYFWDKLRKRLNLANVRIHDLRHTFASMLLASGHSLYEAQTILGHADSRSTMIYAHLENSRLLKAVDNAAARIMGVHDREAEDQGAIDPIKEKMEEILRESIGKIFREMKKEFIQEMEEIRKNFYGNFKFNEFEYF